MTNNALTIRFVEVVFYPAASSKFYDRHKNFFSKFTLLAIAFKMLIILFLLPKAKFWLLGYWWHDSPIQRGFYNTGTKTCGTRLETVSSGHIIICSSL